MNRRILIGVGIAVVLVAGWALFRPELLFVSKTVNEEFPAATAATMSQKDEPKELLSGTFHKGAHETKGKATIYELPDGKRVLRLTEFETSNGPNVHVYLLQANDAKDNATVKNTHFIDLGSIKGNKGDQNYDVPSDVDLSTHRAVTIWCARFGVNFGTAPLMEGKALTGQRMDRMAERSNAPKAIASGKFHGVAHKTEGMATVYELPDGKRVLRFTEFETSNGPDVRVFLVAANDANDNATVKKAGYFEIARLKGNKGDQNYELPGDVDLNKYRAVTIWCKRFGVNFATAPLKQG